jgi:phospholipid transport system transporter-binding protein
MLALPQNLTMAGAPETLRMLSQALQREPGDQLSIDASALRHFDSAAIAVLLECRRLAQAWGKSFEVHAAPQKLRDLAHMYGVQDLVKIA